MTRLAALFFFIGFFLGGLGMGVGWAYRWTTHPALLSIVFYILAGILLIVGTLLRVRHRSAPSKVRY